MFWSARVFCQNSIAAKYPTLLPIRLCHQRTFSRHLADWLTYAKNSGSCLVEKGNNSFNQQQIGFGRSTFFEVFIEKQQERRRWFFVCVGATQLTYPLFPLQFCECLKSVIRDPRSVLFTTIIGMLSMFYLGIAPYTALPTFIVPFTLWMAG